MTPHKAVFLDRDGTLNEEVNYLSRVEDLRVFDFAAKALMRFRDMGFLNVVITNQSGIARGILTEDELMRIHDKLSMTLSYNGGSLIDGIYFSPYHPEGMVEQYKLESNFRKPGTGMIEQAMKDLNIDLKESYLVGDSLTDMQCANNAGLRKVLVATGHGSTEYDKCVGTIYEPDFFATDLLEASEYIISELTHKET